MRKLGLYFAAACIVVLALLASMPRSHVKADDQQGSIVGTWFNTVLLNTPSGPVPFTTELVSFNRGGTLINTNSINFNAQNPALAGTPFAVNFSDAYGTWKPVGDDPNQFAITFKGFIFAGANTPTAVYGSFFPGENVGVFTVEAVATLQTTASGQTLTGPFTNQLANLQGMTVFAGSGTFSATRVNILPLATP